MQIIHDDMLAILPTLDANSIDAVVTDPPYHLVTGKQAAARRKFVDASHRRGFMGQEWDGGDIAFRVETWTEVLRVLKPGGHMLCFGGTRTWHRLACAIEDAGFEIRDTLMFLYGVGFPKSHDISKAIDKHLGAERGIIGPRHYLSSRGNHNMHDGWHRPWMDDPAAVRASMMETAPATPEAQQWAGWGSALKPAYEPILLCRKPLIGTLAENTLAYGVGGLNIDGCRVPGIDPANERRLGKSYGDAKSDTFGQVQHAVVGGSSLGRWPANLIHDGSDEVVQWFPQSATPCGSPKKMQGNGGIFGGGAPGTIYSDEGSAARFFYSAKASKKDRCGSSHPTVKPIALLKYLITLITPPGGTVLDPFAGSGTTGQACAELGFDYILIERESSYIDDIKRRIPCSIVKRRRIRGQQSSYTRTVDH